jgi:hypothetical protein
LELTGRAGPKENEAVDEGVEDTLGATVLALGNSNWKTWVSQGHLFPKTNHARQAKKKREEKQTIKKTSAS